MAQKAGKRELSIDTIDVGDNETKFVRLSFEEPLKSYDIRAFLSALRSAGDDDRFIHFWSKIKWISLIPPRSDES